MIWGSSGGGNSWFVQDRMSSNERGRGRGRSRGRANPGGGGDVVVATAMQGLSVGGGGRGGGRGGRGGRGGEGGRGGGGRGRGRGGGPGSRREFVDQGYMCTFSFSVIPVFPVGTTRNGVRPSCCASKTVPLNILPRDGVDVQ